MIATILHGATPLPSWLASRLIVNIWNPFSFFVLITESLIGAIASGLDLTGPISFFTHKSVATRARLRWD